ncbi:hypothetical protein PIOMA14_I_0238 [Prevotella intermedia]|uniref:Uncharacterized protein n=1 Tax=Prevotella intermedia TaxID=28131 RepID=A0A0S3UGZ0_PREIN|nr:hypothetical protein PIOMA14_I_0238 [Prevotella intermedia]
MQIVPFLPHYQLVFANFDFASFSVISYTVKAALLQSKNAAFASSKNMSCIFALLFSSYFFFGTVFVY